jgi:hypothetical protein
MWALFKALSALYLHRYIFHLLYYPEEEGLLRLLHGVELRGNLEEK